MKTERTSRGGGDRNNKGRRARQRQEELVKTGRTSRGGEASKFRGQGKNKGEGDH